MNQFTQPSDGFHYPVHSLPTATPSKANIDRQSQALPNHLAAILNQALADKQQAITMSPEQYKQLQFAQAWQCLACGCSGILIGAIAYHILFPVVPPQTVIQEKPVIVQQEKAVIVERNCVAFCGK